MDKQNLLTLASKLILASTTGDEKELQKVTEQLAAELQQGKSGEAPPVLYPDETGFLKFTNQEILKMPNYFKKTFYIRFTLWC